MGYAKVDLHLHLDGSLDLETSYRLAKERHLVKEDCSLEEFSNQMIVPSDNPSLEEYLKCFDFPIAIMQDKAALEESVYALIRNLHQSGLIYAEIRFAPQFHTAKGLSQEEVVEAVISGRNKAMHDFAPIKINLILCMMTIGPEAMNHDENVETLHIAKKFYGQGVVAVDLAGNEGVSPILDYKPLFEMAKEMGLRYTIHAGESGPASNVNDAMDMGALRIGHGGHCTWDPIVKQRVIDERIPLEICPTSNVHCCSQPSYEKHALVELFKEGACVTINTDNMTLSRINLEYEMKMALEKMGFSASDVLEMTKNSIRSAFISEEEKLELLAKL